MLQYPYTLSGARRFQNSIVGGAGAVDTSGEFIVATMERYNENSFREKSYE
jgi:hypothetical protein